MSVTYILPNCLNCKESDDFETCQRFIQVFKFCLFPLQGVLYILAKRSEFSLIEKCGSDSFKAEGLHLTVLEPLRRWRILFNGILK